MLAEIVNFMSSDIMDMLPKAVYDWMDSIGAQTSSGPTKGKHILLNVNRVKQKNHRVLVKEDQEELLRQLRGLPNLEVWCRWERYVPRSVKHQMLRCHFAKDGAHPASSRMARRRRWHKYKAEQGSVNCTCFSQHRSVT
jgi:hypothetical protein